jgi:hypothetical protein
MGYPALIKIATLVRNPTLFSMSKKDYLKTSTAASTYLPFHFLVIMIDLNNYSVLHRAPVVEAELFNKLRIQLSYTSQ